MKRIVLYSIALAIGIALRAQTYTNYDFSAVAPNGHTLYYKLENNDTEVSLVRPKKNYLDLNEYNPSGNVIVPSVVDFMGRQFPVTKIGTSAFEGCQITSIQLPNSIINIGASAFKYSHLKSIEIPTSVIIIGENAFQRTNLTSVEIPESVIFIGDHAFNQCGLRNISVLCTKARTGYNIFWQNPIAHAFFEQYMDIDKDHLISVTFGDKAQSIPKPFYNCKKLTKVVVGNNISIIPDRCFEDCENLRTVILGRNVSQIGERAFRKCVNLDTVYAKSINPPQLSATSFNFTPNDLVVVTRCDADYSTSWGTTGFNYVTEKAFTLRLSENCPECGKATFMKIVDCDNTATIEAVPNTNFKFLKWSDGNTSNPREITLTKNTDLKAIFERNTYNVTGISNDTIMGNVIGSGFYNIGDSVTLTAKTNCGYRFLHWSGGISHNPIKFIPTRDTQLIAYFNLALDTIFVPDTSLETVILYDTTIQPITLYDTNTIVVQVFDTMKLSRYTYDTVFFSSSEKVIPLLDGDYLDTIYIQDSPADNKRKGKDELIRVFQNKEGIIVDGVQEEDVAIYRINEKILKEKKKTSGSTEIEVPAPGTYLVRIGNNTTRKVVVIK